MNQDIVPCLSQYGQSHKYAGASVPDPALCEKLLEEAGTPNRVRRHCRAVAAKADWFAKHLIPSGFSIDREKLYAASLLHDIARTCPNHAALGARWLTKLGYPEIGIMVACHHELSREQEKILSETTLLYLADKLVQEDREVTLDKRFFESFQKCNTEAGKRLHLHRYEQAKRVHQMVMNCLCM